MIFYPIATVEINMDNDMLIGRITLNPEVLVGKPVIRGTRLSVDFIIGLLGQGWTEQEVLRNYPGLVSQDIQACLQYAAVMLQQEKVYPLKIA